jgi:polysaccharide pyruvyl transferase WcaK-like protein
MTLSVCMVSGAPAHRVAAVLAPLGDLVDEVVLAQDRSSATADPEASYAGVVDVLVQIPFGPPGIERTLPWLHRQCSGDWILRLDDDEIPSADLAASLAATMADDRFSHMWIPRRWLYGAPDRALDGAPWWPDFQLRMVRNDPWSMRFSGALHSSVEMPGGARYGDAPIYHLDCLLNDRDARERKAVRYAAERPGLRAAGRPMNRAFYLPELAEPVAIVPVDRRDLEHIERSLHSTSTSIAAAGRDPARYVVRTATQDEIDAHWPPARPNPDAGCGAVVAADIPETAVAGDRLTLLTHVRNASELRWRAADPGRSPISVASHWHPHGAPDAIEGERTALPADVLPGETIALRLQVLVPAQPGTYDLVPSLVMEHVRWFGAGEAQTVQVVPRRRVGIVAGYSPYRHFGDDAIVHAHITQLETVLDGCLEPLLFGESPPDLQARFGSPAVASIHGALYGGGPKLPGRAATALRGLRLLGRLRRPGHPSLSPTERHFVEHLASCDALIAASAGGLTSQYWRAAMWPQLWTILVAKALGIPAVVSGATIGPFSHPLDRILAAVSLRAADKVVVRDAVDSPRALRRMRLGPDRIEVAPDPALALGAASKTAVDDALDQAGVPRGVEYVAISLGGGSGDPRRAAQAVAEVLAAVTAKGLHAVFVPMVSGSGEGDDVHLLATPTDMLGTAPLHVLDPLPADHVIAGIIERAYAAVGTRYHLAVFAAAAGVPAIGFYDEEYGRRRLAGIATTGTGSVTAVPLGSTNGTVLAAAEQALQGGARKARQIVPLPALTDLERSLTRARPTPGRARPG